MLFDEKLNIKCGKEMIRQITLLLKLITKLQNKIYEKDDIIEHLEIELGALQDEIF